MRLKAVLLLGAAIGAIAISPAVAGQTPNIHVTVLNRDAVVLKTSHVTSQSHTTTYTFSGAVDTSISTAADYKVKTKLGETFATWRNSSSCALPDQHIKLSTRRTKYAKIGPAMETSSSGNCPRPTVLYGDTYELTTRKALGKTDNFQSELIVHAKDGHRKLKGELELNVDVHIGR